MRDAPSLVIIPKLLEEGALVRTFDPIGMDSTRRLLKGYEGISYASDAYDAVKDADLLLLITEWE